MNDDQFMQNIEGREDEIWEYELTALPKIHLWFQAKGEGNPVTVIALLSVGILLLVVSYINFLNFSVAMASVRVRNLNIRKIFGESSFMLKMSVIMETVFLSFVSFLLSILVIQFLNTGTMKDFFIADLSITKNPDLLFFAGVISIVAGFLAGIYPASYSTAFNPAVAISGTFTLSSHNKWLKNILTSVQFIAAIFLITATLFVKIQYDYMRNKDWGIQTENVLFLNIELIRDDVENFMTELKQYANIVDVTTSSFYPGGQNGLQGWGRKFEGVSINIKVWSVKSDFFDFFGVKLINGETFKENDHDKMILNRAFSKEYDFNDDIMNKYISGYEIIGIVENFNYKSVQTGVEPLAFILIPDNRKYLYNWVFVKTNGANTTQTAEYISKTWKKFSSEPVEVLSLTDTIKSLYQKEYNTASLVSICGIIAIIVAVIGLYGLILFDAKAKRKTIAIHKIHGASITEVMLMLNHGLLVRYAISCLVAFPLSYYAVQRWLEEFAYTTPIYWWVFALGGIIVLIISLMTVSWESYKAASANPLEVIKAE